MLATSFFTHPDAVGFSANDLNEAAPHFYTRWSNPTLELLETRLAALDGGEAALSFTSGMAAISALFLDRLGSGDNLVLSNVCYAGRWGVQLAGVAAKRQTRQEVRHSLPGCGGVQ